MTWTDDTVAANLDFEADGASWTIVTGTPLYTGVTVDGGTRGFRGGSADATTTVSQNLAVPVNAKRIKLHTWVGTQDGVAGDQGCAEIKLYDAGGIQIGGVAVATSITIATDYEEHILEAVVPANTVTAKVFCHAIRGSTGTSNQGIVASANVQWFISAVTPYFSPNMLYNGNFELGNSPPSGWTFVSGPPLVSTTNAAYVSEGTYAATVTAVSSSDHRSRQVIFTVPANVEGLYLSGVLTGSSSNSRDQTQLVLRFKNIAGTTIDTRTIWGPCGNVRKCWCTIYVDSLPVDTYTIEVDLFFLQGTSNTFTVGADDLRVVYFSSTPIDLAPRLRLKLPSGVWFPLNERFNGIGTTGWVPDPTAGTSTRTLRANGTWVEEHPPVSIAAGLDYASINPSTQVITLGLVDLSTDAFLSATTVVPATSPIANPPFAICYDCAATNLVPNPKFAASPFNFGYLPTAAGGTITVNTSNPWIGTQCAQVSTSALNQGIETGYLPVAANTRYIFSVYLRGNAGGEDVYFQFVPIPGGPNTAIGAKSFSAGRLTTKWSRYVFEVTTGPSHTNAACRIMSQVGTAQTFFIDGLQLEVEQVNADFQLQARHNASSYLDGDLGRGFLWSGTPNQSASSRIAGYHFIGNHNKAPWGRLTIRPDGSIGNLTLRADRDGFDEVNGITTGERFPYMIYGDMFTSNLRSGSLGSLIKIINERGSCIWLESGTRDDAGVIFNFPSLTSGVGMAIYAPNDLDTMAANNGRFFAFLDKVAGSSYSWFVDRFEVGAGNSPRNKQVIQHNGGRAGIVATTGQTTLTGNITCTAGGAVTGTGGTAFLTDFVPGDQVAWVIDSGFGDTFVTVASIESNTAMTVVPYLGGPIASTARSYRKTNNKAGYSPAILMLESDRSSHANTAEFFSVPVSAGEFWGLFPSSHDGLWRSHKSTSFGSKEMPANAQDGDAFHMTRGFAHAITVTGVAAWTDVATLYTLRQSAHYPGATYKLRFIARIAADTVVTDSYQYRVLIGATAGPLGALIQVDSTGIVNVEGEITMTYLAAGAGWRIMNIIKHIGNGYVNAPSLVHSSTSNIAAITDALPQVVKLQINPSNSARSITFDIVTLERIC